MALVAGSVSVDMKTANVTYTPNQTAMAGRIYDALKASVDSTNAKIKLPPLNKPPPALNEMDPQTAAAIFNGLAGIANAMAAAFETILKTDALVGGASGQIT